jgi:DNA-binding transcriptional ArsR family regulator
MPPPTLSGHLNVLKAAGLVEGQRRGTTITYRLDATVVEETVATVLELFRVGDRDQREGAGELVV